MSLAGRVQGDLVRYWNAHGIPVKEELTVTYAPNDWRGVELPPEVHNLYAPELARLAREEAVAPVDGDGNNYSTTPESVVNRWLVESRAYTHAQAEVDDDALLEPVSSDNPHYFDFFRRPPRKGVIRINKTVYDMMVGRVRSRYEQEITAFAELQIAEHMNRRSRLGDAVADVLLGPIPNVDELIASIMKTYDDHPEVH